MTTTQTAQKNASTPIRHPNGGAPKRPGAQQRAPKPEESKPAAKARLPLARRTERKVTNLVKRFTKLANSIGGWSPEIRAALDVTSAGLGNIAGALHALPDTFTPAGKAPRGAGKSDIVVGTKVDVTPKAAKRYEDILDPEQTKGLEVTKINGKQVFCKTKDGDKLIIPRGHLMIVTVAEAPTAEA